MAKQVQPLEIILGIKGAEKLAALKSSFRDLTKTVKQSDEGIDAARKSINDYAKSANSSEAVIKGQIKAFEGLREQAAMGGKVYSELSNNINKLQSTLRGSSDAVERQRESLVRLGNASKSSADELRLVIGQLEKLKSKVRGDSAAFSQLNKDIAKLNTTLKEIETSAGKARFAISTILSARPEKITGQIEKLSAAIASGKLEAEDLNLALRKLELLRVGAGRGPVAFRADVFSSQLGVDYFARLRKEYDNLEKTQAAITQRISEVNTELRNVTGYERRRSLTLELIRLNKELQQSIVDVTTSEQFQAMAIRQRMGRARESYAESGFGAFSADIRQRTAAGEFTPGMERARKRAKDRIVDEKAVEEVTDIFSTWLDSYDRIERAANNHKVEMARIQASQGDLLIQTEDRKHDQKLRAQQEQYDEEIRLFDQKLKQRDRVLQRSGSVKSMLGLSGRELSPLYGGIVGISEARARGEQARMGRTPQQALADVVNVFNSDLSRTGDGFLDAEKKLRESAIDFAGGSKRVRQKFEDIALGKTPMAMFPQAGESKGDYRKRIEGSARNLFESVRNFGDRLKGAGDGFLAAEKKLRESAIKFANNSVEIERAFKQVPLGKTPMSMFPGASETPESYVQRMRGGFAQFDLPDFSSFRKGTTRELQLVRESLAELRLDLDPLAVSFEKTEKRIVKSISKIDKELERRQRGRRRLSGMQMTQAAGAVISGGIFGGPEGLLGGAIGAFGGVGGAFAGAAIGAQVGAIRKTLGGYADYAAQIERLKIALGGIAGPQEEYNRALNAANSVTKSLNVPQEVAIQGITRLTAAVKGAGGGVADAELAFKNINSAIIATGGGAEQVEGAVTALVQIFSKGKVSAEEINQIAERLPGTFNKIAAASGRTGPELTKALQDGKVGLNDLMKFLVSLGDEYGELAEKIAGSSENAGARLQIAFNNMRIEVGKALQPIGAEFQDTFTRFIEDITPALVASTPVIARGFKSLLDSVVKTGKAIAEVANFLFKIFSGVFKEIQRQGEESSKRIKKVFSSIGNFFSKVGKFVSEQWQLRFGEVVLNSIKGGDKIKKVMQSFGEFWKQTVDFMGKYWGNFVEYAVNAFAGVLTGPVQIILQKAGINLGKIVAASVSGFGGGPSAPTPTTDDTPDLPINLTDFPGPDDDESGGSKKAARDAKRKADEIASLRRAYDALFANRGILTIQMQQIDAARDLKDAQDAYNQKLVDEITVRQSGLQFEKEIIEARNEYEARSLEIKETLEGEAALTAELIAKEQLLQKLAVALGEQFGRIKDINADITRETKEQNEAIQQQLIDRQRQLGLISQDEYNQSLMGREERRIRRQFPRASEEDRAQMLDLYRQEIDPTPFEKMRQNIAQLKEELNTLIEPVNQITNAANAIGDAFAQSFVDAISGATTAKQALADFFQSVGSYFLDMAKQMIAKMIQIAILNSIVKLLPGGGGAGGGGGGSGAFDLGGMGQAFAPGGSMPFPMRANGGPVSPGSTYLVGERGPELLTMGPSGGYVTSNSASQAAMDRYSSGNARGGSISVNYNVTDINGMRFVTEDQFRAGVAQAAKQGADGGFNRTMSSLKNNRSTRSRIGV